MQQAHRNRIFHDFRKGACRNLVCTGKEILSSLMNLVSKSAWFDSYLGDNYILLAPILTPNMDSPFARKYYYFIGPVILFSFCIICPFLSLTKSHKQRHCYRWRHAFVRLQVLRNISAWTLFQNVLTTICIFHDTSVRLGIKCYTHLILCILGWSHDYNTPWAVTVVIKQLW